MNENIKLEQCRRLKEWIKYLKSNGLIKSQASFATEVLGIEPESLSPIINGKKPVSEKTIRKILEYQEGHAEFSPEYKVLADWIRCRCDYRTEADKEKHEADVAEFLAAKKYNEIIQAAKADYTITEISKMLIGALIRNDGIELRECKTGPFSREYIFLRKDKNAEDGPYVDEEYLDKLSKDLARIADEFLRSHLEDKEYKGGNYNGKY